MSFLNFSEDQYIKTFDTGEKISLGSFKTQTSGELGNIRCLLYVNDVLSMVGTERIKLTIYSDQYLLNAMHDSAWSLISDISLSDSTYGDTQAWLGFFRFDFNKLNINKNITYYVGATIDNYTRSGSTFVGLGYDYPFPVYDNGNPQFFQHNISFQIFLYG